jgi:sulfur carrier protein ThiS
MSVSAALAELGSREALIALAVNGGAEIADHSGSITASP